MSRFTEPKQIINNLNKLRVMKLESFDKQTDMVTIKISHIDLCRIYGALTHVRSVTGEYKLNKASNKELLKIQESIGDIMLEVSKHN